MQEVKGLDPIVDENCIALLLGSFPSVISRKNSFYYANPQNKFWKIIGEIFEGQDLRGESDRQKSQVLLKHHIALWDIVERCEIEGSSDSAITHYQVVNLDPLLKMARIQKIFFNGKKSAEIFAQHYHLNIPTVILPSTSPANAAASRTIQEIYRIQLLNI